MSTAKMSAGEFSKTYGTKDSRSVNDCYAIYSGNGINFINLFMHTNTGIKSAFSINDLGRNEDIKLHEAEIINSLHPYSFFDKFGLDIILCNHVMDIIVTKPGLKNTGCKFQMHNQIFNPNEDILAKTPGIISEENFYDLSKIKPKGMTPFDWYINECKKYDFYISDNGDISLDYGFPVMGKTTSYWRENIPREKIISVKQKCLPNTSALTNRILSLSTVRAIQIASELASEKTVVLASRQRLDLDIKSQYRISFPGVQDEGAFTRTFCIPMDKTARIVCFYAKTSVDVSNERTTLTIKIVNKTVESNYMGPVPKDHMYCDKSIGARIGLVDIVRGDPNYNQMIAREMISVHTNFALRLSEALKKPVIVFKMYEKELNFETYDLSGRSLSYQKDSSGNIYFLSRTLEILPKSLSTLTYLKNISPACWKESISMQHFYIGEQEEGPSGSNLAESEEKVQTA
ncbi:NSs [Tomato zonate spot virus]|uniref:NSs n=1 Tax=Tomato zonate spot virus TaxID=460926 RepID=B1NK03_9VIRU|nr:NSs [Tomato zonate spot virus]ABU49101.1 NSs [Tomato zonate spot virus]QEY10701.1 nonstructural protein [Cloning vector pHRE-EV]QEY10703.1 nonstructural protein [Cloning vector pHREAC-EV]